MRLDRLRSDLRSRFDATNAARERALPASRRAIRACANAIRALHRGEFDRAHELMDEARGALDEGLAATADHPQIRHAGYLQDAQKEYAEARLTEAVLRSQSLPEPADCGVDDAPYLGGMSDAIGEGRRHVLDLLRAGDVARGEAVLVTMEDMFSVLVEIDYPDAITLGLRRQTDSSRALIEKTRGDLSIAIVQRDLRDALDRHAREVLGRQDT
ncbi:MAG: haloacid dehalogenase [Actinomycetota bacterium]